MSRLTPHSSPSSEADSFAASQNIRRILQNLQFATSRNLCLPSATLTQSTPHILFHLFYHFPIYVWVLQMIVSFRFPHQNPARTFNFPHTCHKPSQSLSPWLDDPNIYSKKCISWSSSLCNFLHPLATALSDPTYLPQHPLLQHLQPVLLSMCETKFHTHINQQAKLPEFSVFTPFDSKRVTEL